MYQTSTFSNTSSLSGPTWFRSQDWLTLNDGKEDDNYEKEESDVKEDPVGFVNVPICWLNLITCKTQREAASVNLFFWDNVTNFWCNLTQNDAKHCSARLCDGRRSGGEGVIHYIYINTFTIKGMRQQCGPKLSLSLHTLLFHWFPSSSYQHFAF